MNKLAYMAADSFKNFIANLNTGRDKQAGGDYSLLSLTDAALMTIYRVSWLARKVVDIPAQDATRKWREWQAEADQIEVIEETERRIRLPQKVKLALQQSRLYGGSAIYYSIRNDDPALPLDLDSVKAGGLDFATVLSRDVLTAGEIEMDPLMPGYGRPKYYEVSSTSAGTQQIHPSRLAIFLGHELLTTSESTGISRGWGDSVLQAAYEAIRGADATASNIMSLVYEAKVDILQIPDLATIMQNPKSREALENRVALSAQLKGNNGMLIIDGEEEYNQKQYSFTGLPEINYQALQAVSGAADIPVTRFLGQSPAGLSSTGESDLKNYYDAVNSMQKLLVTPAIHMLDECVLRSSLGNRPPDITYEWGSLWQMSDEQRSKIGKETAETIQVLQATQLFPDDVLAEAAANMLVERGIVPSIEFNVETPTTPEEEEEDDTVV